jgi:hypothetical protein
MLVFFLRDIRGSQGTTILEERNCTTLIYPNGGTGNRHSSQPLHPPEGERESEIQVAGAHAQLFEQCGDEYCHHYLLIVKTLWGIKTDKAVTRTRDSRPL